MKRPQLLSQIQKTDVLSKAPLIELAGRSRVLIENHRGVLAYSLEEICVKVSYGSVCVTGSGLHLLQMSKEQLVICGEITGIALLGR